MDKYHSIKKMNDGSIAVSFHTSLLEAYRSSKAKDNSDECLRLFNGVLSELNKGERVIRISCNKEFVSWIQVVSDINVKIPDVDTLPVGCCH